MKVDLEEELFLSLEKYYGKPKIKNRTKYKRKYRYTCFISKYISNYIKSWDRFSELFEKFRVD